MLWIVQRPLAREAGLDELLRVLDLAGFPFHEVRLVDRDKIVDAALARNDDEARHAPALTIDEDQPIMVMGSYALSRLAQARGWRPGAISGVDDNFETWRSHWGEHMLNADAQIAALIDNIPPVSWSKVFVRPVDDTKAFNGRVFERDEFLDWQRSIVDRAPSRLLTAQTRIVIAPVKVIHKEHRFFVVDGQVVTGSLYAWGNAQQTSTQVDTDALEFAQRMTNLWQPAPAFALDVATTEQGHFIVEAQGLPVSSLYEANVGRLVMALEDWAVTLSVEALARSNAPDDEVARRRTKPRF